MTASLPAIIRYPAGVQIVDRDPCPGERGELDAAETWLRRVLALGDLNKRSWAEMSVAILMESAGGPRMRSAGSSGPPRTACPKPGSASVRS
jgi:hypothetical protein